MIYQDAWPLVESPLPVQGPTQEKGLIRTIDSFLAAGIDLDGVVRAVAGGRDGTAAVCRVLTLAFSAKTPALEVLSRGRAGLSEAPHLHSSSTPLKAETVRGCVQVKGRVVI